MAENKESLRALKIKTGVLTRVKKELAMYEKEVVTEGAKLEKMKAEGADAHDVKQQDQVLGESKMMITDCETRLENAFNDLLEAVVRATTRRSTRRPRAPPRPAPPRPVFQIPRARRVGGVPTRDPAPSPARRSPPKHPHPARAGRTRRRVRGVRGARRGEDAPGRCRVPRLGV